MHSLFQSFSLVVEAVSALPAASRIASRLEAGRRPKAGDLARLGIDLRAFEQVRQN
jgi:hypothetical protein